MIKNLMKLEQISNIERQWYNGRDFPASTNKVNLTANNLNHSNCCNNCGDLKHGKKVVKHVNLAHFVRNPMLSLNLIGRQKRAESAGQRGLVRYPHGQSKLRMTVLFYWSRIIFYWSQRVKVTQNSL